MSYKAIRCSSWRQLATSLTPHVSLTAAPLCVARSSMHNFFEAKCRKLEGPQGRELGGSHPSCLKVLWQVTRATDTMV